MMKQMLDPIKRINREVVEKLLTHTLLFITFSFVNLSTKLIFTLFSKYTSIIISNAS